MTVESHHAEDSLDVPVGHAVDMQPNLERTQVQAFKFDRFRRHRQRIALGFACQASELFDDLIEVGQDLADAGDARGGPAEESFCLCQVERDIADDCAEPTAYLPTGGQPSAIAAYGKPAPCLCQFRQVVGQGRRRPAYCGEVFGRCRQQLFSNRMGDLRSLNQ